MVSAHSFLPENETPDEKVAGTFASIPSRRAFNSDVAIETQTARTVNNELQTAAAFSRSFTRLLSPVIQSRFLPSPASLVSQQTKFEHPCVWPILCSGRESSLENCLPVVP